MRMGTGCIVLAYIFQWIFIASVVLGLSTSAHSDELAMPFSCTVDAGGVHVTRDSVRTYPILGGRSERAFVDCGGRDTCRTLMIHRFEIQCFGGRVAWVRVANAAQKAGIALPDGLPPGFAPVSTMSGRFLLPAPAALANRGEPVEKITADYRVSRQALSPDSVLAASEAEDDRGGIDGWQTEVHANALATVQTAVEASDSTATRLAASLVAALVLLFTASMVAAGRLRLPAIAGRGGAFAHGFEIFSRAMERAGGAFGNARERAARWREDEAEPTAPHDEIANGVAILRARLLHVELKIEAIPPGLLRDVLSREVAAVRTRFSGFEASLGQRPSAKAAAAIRAMMRELERINRIAATAGTNPEAEQTRTTDEAMPQSEADAYRILGINPDAPAEVAKKLVDALRMNWHPDHARDEHDRQRREVRMRQINAAWDIFKARRAA